VLERVYRAVAWQRVDQTRYNIVCKWKWKNSELTEKWNFKHIQMSKVCQNKEKIEIYLVM
jgi:hypothetical protein